MASFIPNVTDIFPEPSLYRPDFSYMDNMLRRRQSMYDRGFQELAGKYKFVNREVSNPYNAKTKDEFINKAMVNLKDLSAMDLSQQQNVTAASDVFEPFVKNTDVLGDMALTSHWNQQESVAESFRLKDGGKEFSQDNLDYVRKQRQKFTSDNPNTWKDYYSNRRSYTPYYDWNKEFRDWFKDYKPNSVSIERRAGLYNITEENKGATAQDLKMFFSSVASEKAKSQLRIESAVRIGDNVEQVLPYYKGAIQSDINALDKEIGSLTNQLKLNKDPNQKAQLQEALKARTEKADDLRSDMEKVNSGDMSYVKANAEKISFALYFDQAVSKLANGLSWQDYKREISGDDVAIMKWKDAQDWARTKFTADRADKRAEMELLGGPDQFTQVSRPAGEGDVVNKGSLNDLALQTTGNNAANAKLSQMLSNHVGLALNKNPNQVTQQDVNDYAKSRRGQMDPVYLNYKRQLTGIVHKQDILENQREAAENFAKQKLGDSYLAIKGDLDQFKKRKSELGITANEMLDAVISGKAEFTPQRDESGKPINGLYTIIVNGKKVSASKSLFGDDPIVNMYEDAVRLTESVGPQKYKKAVDQYFGEAKISTDKAFIPNTTGKLFKSLTGNLSGVLAVDPANIQGLMLGGRNDAYFSIDNEKFRKDPEAAIQVVKDRMTSLGFDVNYDEKIKSFYIKEKQGFTKINLGLDMYSKYSDDERNLITYGQREAGHMYTSPTFYPGDNVTDRFGKPVPQFYYRVMMNGEDRMYYLYNENKGDQPLKVSTSLTDVMDFARTTAENYSTVASGLNN